MAAITRPSGRARYDSMIRRRPRRCKRHSMRRWSPSRTSSSAGCSETRSQFAPDRAHDCSGDLGGDVCKRSRRRARAGSTLRWAARRSSAHRPDRRTGRTSPHKAGMYVRPGGGANGKAESLALANRSAIDRGTWTGCDRPPRAGCTAAAELPNSGSGHRDSQASRRACRASLSDMAIGPGTVSPTIDEFQDTKPQSVRSDHGAPSAMGRLPPGVRRSSRRWRSGDRRSVRHRPCGNRLHDRDGRVRVAHRRSGSQRSSRPRRSSRSDSVTRSSRPESRTSLPRHACRFRSAPLNRGSGGPP